jgi:glutathionylspermidine synthase
MAVTRFIEPPWKAILSNKGILPLLWEMAPRHPNLLPAYFEDDPARSRLQGRYAKKPLYSREGQNVLLIDGDRVVDRDGGLYGNNGFIVQQLARMPVLDGNYPVIGSWVIGEGRRHRHARGHHPSPRTRHGSFPTHSAVT